MKKLLFFALLMFLFSCKDSVNELPDPFIEPTKIANVDTMALYDQVLKIDTIILEKLNKLNIADKVLAVTLKTGFSKDSVEISSCRIDFYFKNKLLQSIPLETIASHEDPIWSFYEDVFTNQKSNKSDNRFFEISYGVPACGFT